MIHRREGRGKKSVLLSDLPVGRSVQLTIYRRPRPNAHLRWRAVSIMETPWRQNGTSTDVLVKIIRNIRSAHARGRSNRQGETCD